MDDRERNRQGLTNFLDALQSVLISIQNLHEIDNDREVELEQVRDRLQDARITLQLIASTVVNVYHRTAANELITLLNTILSCISEHLNSGEEDNVNNTAFVCPTREPQGVGRPAIVVNEDQIQFFRSLHFSWKKIASLLGISESTLRRRRGGIAESNQGNGSDITGKRVMFFLGVLYELYIRLSKLHT